MQLALIKEGQIIQTNAFPPRAGSSISASIEPLICAPGGGRLIVSRTGGPLSRRVPPVDIGRGWLVAEVGEGTVSVSSPVPAMGTATIAGSLSFGLPSVDVLSISCRSDVGVVAPLRSSSSTWDGRFARLEERRGFLVVGAGLSLAVLLRAERRGTGEGLSTFWRFEGGPSLIESKVVSMAAGSVDSDMVGLAEERRANFVSFCGTSKEAFDSLAALRLPAGSEVARSCEPRGVGNEFRDTCLLTLAELAKSSAVGGPIRAAAAFMASLRDAARGVGGILTRPIANRRGGSCARRVVHCLTMPELLAECVKTCLRIAPAQPE